MNTPSEGLLLVNLGTPDEPKPVPAADPKPAEEGDLIVATATPTAAPTATSGASGPGRHRSPRRRPGST